MTLCLTSITVSIQGVKYSIEKACKRHVATWRTNAQLNNLFANSPYFSIRVVIVLCFYTLTSYTAA